MMNDYSEDDSYDDIIDDEMSTGCLGNIVIIKNTRSAIAMAKGTYPARYGLYGEIRTREFSFHFNPTGEIRYIRGLTHNWPHPWEWLKRTWGNDWIYYSVGLNSGQGRVKDWVGENYLPCLSYESNAIREVNPYTEPGIASAFSAWTQIYGTLCSSSLDGLSDDIREFVNRVIRTNDDNALIDQTGRLHEIIGGRVSVLPPDTRHVDYEVIPVNIADGCLYKCTFCSVKTGKNFRPRSHDDIVRQLEELAQFYDSNLQNLNAVFIGDHDALAAGGDLISFAAEKAYEIFQFSDNRGGTPSLFTFGSAGSFLKADATLFERLNTLPYKSYINLGLEAYDSDTLKKIGKPITPDMVVRSVRKMIHVNESYENIEVSANFLLGTTFSEEHHIALTELLSNLPEGSGKRGCVYLSPLIETQHRDKVLPMFHDIKEKSGLSVYIYLIQRL